MQGFFCLAGVKRYPGSSILGFIARYYCNIRSHAGETQNEQTKSPFKLIESSSLQKKPKKIVTTCEKLQKKMNWINCKQKKQTFNLLYLRKFYRKSYGTFTNSYLV